MLRNLRLKMLPDSRLLDERSGEVHLTGDLYDRVRQMPLSTEHDGSILRNDVALATETTFPSLEKEGPVEATLLDDQIRLRGAVDRSLSLADIQGVDVERNFKLQLFLQYEMVQLSFLGSGSALAWRDALRQLLGETDHSA